MAPSPEASFVLDLPFVRRVGAVADEGGGLALPDDASLHNHVGTVHAGALFTLGEAASGVAVAGVVAALGGLPLAKSATIQYRRPASGRVTAKGALREGVDAIRARVAEAGKTTFEVGVTIADGAGEPVAEMTVTWHLRAAR
ncbi:MAG: DUF4442 domain-containing protein [Myxococcales bacterium]|jgi:acyl-coenzyme A thioesterase PaaI-like protein|nr:DUF4442 domain-containing protein [Myxococcales bacterium]